MRHNGVGAQLRGTGRPTVAEAPTVDARRLPDFDWNALWLVSCSGLLAARFRFRAGDGTEGDLAVVGGTQRRA